MLCNVEPVEVSSSGLSLYRTNLYWPEWLAQVKGDDLSTSSTPELPLLLLLLLLIQCFLASWPQIYHSHFDSSTTRLSNPFIDMVSNNGTKIRQAEEVFSKDMDPLPSNFAPVFFRNQFLTKIELPTKDRYPAVKGQCAIVTGSNTGLGLESARQLLDLDLSHLVMAVRTVAKGETAAVKLRAAYPLAKIEVWPLDMESYDSIQAFVDDCSNKLPHIDMVILNAGLAAVHRAIVSSTGHERTVQVNHISTALLAILLLPVLKSKSSGRSTPRITIVNSVTAHLCKFPNKDERPLLKSFDDTDITPWDPNERYGVSKLISQLFIVRLAAEVSSDDIVINMVDPGLTKSTGLARETTGFLALAVSIFLAIAGRPISRGAATYIDAVLGHGKESHGCFLMNCNIAP